jgi:predicted permease
MSILTRFSGGLRGLFRTSRVEAELDDELREFLAAAVEEQMRAGLTRAEAVRAARVQLGSIEAVKDRVRDVGWESILDGSWRDLQYGARMLRRTPGFTVVVVLLLALGIGANTAVFSVINTLMLRDLPVEQPERLVELTWQYPGDPRTNFFTSSVYEHFRNHNHVFSDLIGVSPARFQLTRDGRDVEMVDGQYVTGTFFPALGVQPAIGRLIAPEDDQIAAPGAGVAVISWPYWQRRFNLNRAVLGSRVVLAGVEATVIGVTPPAFFGLQVGSSADVWVPALMASLVPGPNRTTRDRPPFQLMARLKDGVSIEQARAEMRVLDRIRLDALEQASHDPQWRHAIIQLLPARAGFSQLRDLFAQPLIALMAIVGLMLLIACTNVAGLVLARAASRRHEMAVRVAIGAGRARIVRQVVTESLLLSVAASVIGIVLAYFAADVLARLLPIDARWLAHQSVELRVRPDARVLLFTAGIGLLTGLLFGIAPAWSAFASAVASGLRETGSSGDTKSRRRVGGSLVIAQVALSVTLLAAAALFVRHLSNLRYVDAGFRRDSVLLVNLAPAGSPDQRFERSVRYRELLDRLEAIPGVRSAALAGVTPIEGPAASRFVDVEGYQEKPGERRRVMLNWIAPRYFETLGTPLISGRDFRFDDERHPGVAIVNVATARYYFGDRSPLGKHFMFEGQGTRYEIVGVVADAKYDDLHQSAPRTIYLHAFQERGTANEIALRTNVNPNAVAGDVRRAVRDTLKTVPVTRITTLAEQVDRSIIPERLLAMLAVFFGALGALLAAIGLYGLLAYTIARRVNEIGLRMALGATERDVIRMVLKDALRLVGAGLVAGTPFAIWTKKLAGTFIQTLPVQPALPILFAIVAMVVVALLAAYVPARRAARVHPMEALRHS